MILLELRHELRQDTAVDGGSPDVASEAQVIDHAVRHAPDVGDGDRRAILNVPDESQKRPYLRPVPYMLGVSTASRLSPRLLTTARGKMIPR